MRKQVKRYFRSSLCGILSAAMIAASLIVPDMTVYASPQDDEVSVTTENKAETVEGTTDEGESGKEADGENKKEDGNAGSSSEDGKGSGVESGDGSDKDGDEKLDGEEEKDPDGDLADDEGEEKDVIDEDLKSEDEEEVEEDDEELSISLLADGEYGELLNGDFEEGETVSSVWVPKSWIGSGDDYQLKSNADATNNTTNFVHWWSQNGGTVSISQKIENVEPGIYSVSLQVDQPYSEDKNDPISVIVRSVNGTEKTLTNKSLGEGPKWNTWKTVTTDGFEIAVSNGESQVDIEIKVSGTLGAGETFEIDNVKLNKLSYTLTELSDLLTEANKLNEGDYTEESWSKFASARSTAQTLVNGSSTDATEITLAYANLKAAMDALVSSGMTFYYYVGKTDDEIGLYHWGNTNISSTADIAGWQVWGEKDTYKMSPVTGYAGWYSIPLKIANGGTGAGFKIFKKTDAQNDPDNGALFSCDADHWSEIYSKLASGTVTAYAVKNGKSYEGEDEVTAILRDVTLYVYSEDTIPALHLGNDSAATKLTKINETTGEISPFITSEENEWQYPVWKMSEVAGAENWYQISFVAPGKLEFNDTKICALNDYDGKAYSYKTSFINGGGLTWGVDFTPVFAGQNYYYEETETFYASKEIVEELIRGKLKTELQALIEQAKGKKEDDYTSGWEEFTEALKAAEAVLQAVKEAEDNEDETGPTNAEIRKACEDLKKAMEDLVSATMVKSDIVVKPVELTDDFITGADISSYYALKESGVEFKDENGKPLSDQGFFNYLHEGGMNWARIRIWNDPYNSSGKGYGGGNNDLEKAKIIGKWASNAGMKVLIDFHYSDFWADPAKQKAPKAWAGYSIDQKEKAVYDFTLESLNELRSAGVDVGMVQVGNETNNGICGETDKANMARLFNAGSKAVKEFDEGCLVAVHFTNPQDGYTSIANWLEKEKVEYDVFASSFYPFGHGDTKGLRDALSWIVENKHKKVMVAETSWPTTLIDGDGYGYVSKADISDAYKDQDYGISVQGQADEMRDLIAKVNEINMTYPGELLGVFYWEPAWISPYYIKDEEGNDNDGLYKQNFDLWEKYGSGWASSYAAEYDPEDAGVWYGGSAMDNSSWFDFDGTALPTAKIYSLIRTGAEAEKKIATVESTFSMKVPVGTDIDWPAVVNARYNDGDDTTLPVIWDEDEKELVNSYKAGEYIVHGIASDDKTGTGDYRITLKIEILRETTSNILENPSFETGAIDPWKVETREGHGEQDTDAAVKISNETPHDGGQELHFWSKVTLDVTVSQTITPEAGTYTFGGYIQGGGADIEDVQYAFVTVKGADGKTKSTKKASFALNGWKNWCNPEITGITVEKGDSIEAGVIIKSTKEGAWGSIDDLYLYGTHKVEIDGGIGHGSVTASVVKANSGEKVILTVVPESGYYPETLTLSGVSVLADTLTSSNGTVSYEAAAASTDDNRAVLTYDTKNAEEKSESFTMPKGNVTVSATFASVFDDGKISLDAQGDDGKYLVLVNGKDDDTPIEDQYYTGKNITPAVELSYKGYKLTSKDYTIRYANNKNKTTADKRATITLTAKEGGQFTGTRTISFVIKEDTRKEFKDLKVTFVNPDRGDGSTPDKSIYYLGKQKELTPKIILKDGAGIEIKQYEEDENKVEHKFYEVFYYNNKKLGKATVVVLPTDYALETCKEGSVTTAFRIERCPLNYGKVSVSIPQQNQYYTGKKVEPTVTVKLTYTDNDGEPKTTTLTKGTDYTVAYGNNINATTYYENKVDWNGNPIPRSLAFIRINGIGNFTGVRTTVDIKDGNKPGDKKLTFAIEPRSIENATITAADLVEGSGATPRLTVKDGTKTIASNQYVITKIVKNGTEVVYTYDQQTKVKEGSLNLRDSGSYEVTVAGKKSSNYTDEKAVGFKVTGKEFLIPNAKITIRGKFIYTGKQIRLTTSETDGAAPELEVVAGSGRNAKTLVAGKDYTVAYENNINAGRATITITGTGDYVGKKTAIFTIGKRTLVDARAIKTDRDRLTKGTLQTPKLTPKNIKTQLDGTWTVDANGNLINKDNVNEKGILSIPYTGYTLNPEFTFSATNGGVTDADDSHELSSNDYKVTYSVGKWVNGEAPVTATVRGVGNYSGSVRIPNLFTLTAQDLRELNIEVNQIEYNGGKALKPSVTFSKDDGTVVDLKLGTAYTVTYRNNKLATLSGMAENKQPMLTVKVKGNGWIIDRSDKTSREKSYNFTIDQKEIVKTDVGDIAIQTYRGKALTPAVTIRVNGRRLKAGTDYTVTYSNNVKRSGSTIGTVTIVGKGNYFTRNPITKEFVIK